MDIHNLKMRLQQHLSDGLVTIIGSGLSSAEGLPDMGELAKYLCTNVGTRISGVDLKAWEKTIPLIVANGLEAALIAKAPTHGLEAAITTVTASLILGRERMVIEEVFSGRQTLRLTRLLKHLVKPNSGLPIITTNYDRLVEIAVEEAGMGVDTLFVGRFAGRLDARESKLSFCRDISLQKNHPRLKYAQHAQVYKPHGSLDWYLRGDKPVCYGGELTGAARLIITPGQNKFRNGYESPFDKHRDRANMAIDKAGRFLIIGYGFNDDHLETHLGPAIRSGKPTLLLTHTLSDGAKRLAFSLDNVIALEHTRVDDQDSTRIFSETKEYVFPGIKFWELNSFVTEVLEP